MPKRTINYHFSVSTPFKLKRCRKQIFRLPKVWVTKNWITAWLGLVGSLMPNRLLSTSPQLSEPSQAPRNLVAFHQTYHCWGLLFLDGVRIFEFGNQECLLRCDPLYTRQNDKKRQNTKREKKVYNRAVPRCFSFDWISPRWDDGWYCVILPTVHGHWELIVKNVNSDCVVAKSRQLARKTACVVAWSWRWQWWWQWWQRWWRWRWVRRKPLSPGPARCKVRLLSSVSSSSRQVWEKHFDWLNQHC